MTSTCFGLLSGAMASLKVGDLTSCLIDKLQAVESQGKHKAYEVFDDQGLLVAATHISHGWRASTAIGDEMIATIRRQLRLQKNSQFTDLVSCPMSREAYLATVTGALDAH